MKLLIIISALLLSKLASGQDCEYSVNEIDEFTGQKKLKTELELIYMNLGFGRGQEAFKIWVMASRIDSSEYLKFMFSNKEGFKHTMGIVIMIKLENGEIVKLVLRDDPAEHYSDYWYYRIAIYSKKEEDWEKLKASPIAKIRIYSRENFKDYELKELSSLKLGNAIKCLEKVAN
ncbi:MAG: hypothetical protein IIA45_11245 [Bacteroidetes bacterium]|nr:hypothetical protein [Bacteroidota bacterium]